MQSTIQPQQKMKTKTTSNPGPLSRVLFIAIAVCLSVVTAWTAHAQSGLFVSITGTNQNGGGLISQYTPAGTPSTVASNLDKPRGLAFDSAGNLFVATNTLDNSGNFQGTIFKITPSGLMSTFATGFPANFFLHGMATDIADNVFVMVLDPNSSSPGTIYEITPSGTVSTFGSIPSLGLGLAFDSGGNLFAADNFNQTIYKFTSGGAQSTFAGSAAFPSGEGPAGLAFDQSGNLFVSTELIAGGSAGNDAILKFTPNGIMQPTFATGLTNIPRGLAFDSSGNLFVAELGYNAPGDILEFPPVGPPPTVFASGLGRSAGNGGAEYLAFPPPNTPVASNVTTAVALTFPEGTFAGTTTVAPIATSSLPAPPPANFSLTGDNLAFDITTNVTNITAPIIIAFQVPSSLDVSTLKALHYECDTQIPPNCTWVDRTIYPGDPNYPSSPAPNTIYASVSSLSPFVVAKFKFKAQVQQPINADGSSVFSVKRGVVPVAFTLTSDGVATCQLPPATISVTRTAGAVPGPIDESTYLSSADKGSNFRISNCQYVYNLAASSLGTGTYKVNISIGGTVVGSGTFALK